MTIDVGVIITGAGVIITGVVAIFIEIRSNHQIRTREINSRHFLEKKAAYMHFIELIFAVMSSTAKHKKQTGQKHFTEKMMKFKKELMVWGNHDVFQALEEYEQLVIDREDTDGLENIKVFSPVEKLLRAMRKDLGHDDSQLKPFALVSMLIVAKDKEELFAPK